MISIPFPFFIAEFVVFWWAVQEWGFFNTLGLYLAPCFLGIFIMNLVGRTALMNLQSSSMGGQLPGNKLLHSAALFFAGLLFLIPSFSGRILGFILLVPGLRHLIIWQFKKYMTHRMAKGMNNSFNFGSAGFRYYNFRSKGGGFQDVNGMGSDREYSQERVVRDAEVLDVKPIEITHEDKKKD